MMLTRIISWKSWGWMFLKTHGDVFVEMACLLVFMSTYVFPFYFPLKYYQFAMTTHYLPFACPILNLEIFSQEVIDDPELDAVWDSFFPSTVPVVPEAGSLPGCSGTGVIYTLRNLSFLPQSWFSRKLAPNERKLLLEGTIFHYHELFPGVYFHVSY